MNSTKETVKIVPRFFQKARNISIVERKGDIIRWEYNMFRSHKTPIYARKTVYNINGDFYDYDNVIKMIQEANEKHDFTDWLILDIHPSTEEIYLKPYVYNGTSYHFFDNDEKLNFFIELNRDKFEFHS